VTKAEQVSIARDNEFGVGGERRGKDMIVVGIARDARHFGRLDEFDDLEIISEHVACGFADERELLGCHGATEDAGEFLEEPWAAEELRGGVRGRRAE
jgi:hypothetical protein